MVANQRIKDPLKNDAAFADRSETMLAVISSFPVRKTGTFDNYEGTSFLPDVCSGIFAPGRDITYSNEEYDNPPSGNYLSTRGLGSPSPEDMKLCAAMNGMWPAASPDTARTLQGGLEPNYRNPTAIPLLDCELGLHPESAACIRRQQLP